MSPAVYQEPYKFSAGILALLVHGVFFALLYFGFSWQNQPPATMSVELWQSLPDAGPAAATQVEKAIPPPPTPPAPPPPEVVKPDIVIPEKKPVKKIEAKPVEKPVEKPKPVEKTQEKPRPDVKAQLLSKVVQQALQPGSGGSGGSAAGQQAARDRIAQEAAVGRVVDEYTSKISSKIRRNVVMPPGVADDARAEFLVTLLPGGSVLNARLLKSSGNAAYDNAVERAILKSDPLPLPSDAGMFNKFRELKLGFKPVE